VSLAGNAIDDVASLGALHHLKRVNLANNRLTTVLGERAAPHTHTQSHTHIHVHTLTFAAALQCTGICMLCHVLFRARYCVCMHVGLCVVVCVLFRMRCCVCVHASVWPVCMCVYACVCECEYACLGVGMGCMTCPCLGHPPLSLA